MTGTEQIAVIFGWALVPFILSVTYGCTGCGDKKISPMQDVLAVILGIAAFGITSTMLHGVFASWTHWGILLSAGIGYLAQHFVMVLAYKVFYAGMPDTAAH